MGLQILFEVAAFSGAGIMIGWLEGDAAIIGRAAHQIALNMVSATFMIMLGLSVAGSVRVGEAYGREDRKGVFEAGRAAIIVGFGVIVLTSFILIVFKGYFTKIYGIEDQRVADVTIRLIIIATVFQVFDGMQCIGAGLLRGVQDVKIPTIITFIAYWVIWIPVAYWMGFVLGWGVDGIWYADVIALAFAAICLNWRFFTLIKSKPIHHLRVE
jgi:MATE family multidrug resistance protein